MNSVSRWRDTGHLERAVATAGGQEAFDAAVTAMLDDARGWRAFRPDAHPATHRPPCVQRPGRCSPCLGTSPATARHRSPAAVGSRRQCHGGRLLTFVR